MEIREQIGRVICTVSDISGECERCKKGEGCPDEWPDVAEKAGRILQLFKDNGWVELDEDGGWHRYSTAAVGYGEYAARGDVGVLIPNKHSSYIMKWFYDNGFCQVKEM